MKTRTIRKAIAAVCLAALLLLPGCSNKNEKNTVEPDSAQSILEKMNAALAKACSAEAEIQGFGRLDRGTASSDFDFSLSERTNYLQGRSSLTGSAGLRASGIEMDLPVEAVFDKGDPQAVLYLEMLDVWTKLELPGFASGPENGAGRLWKEKAVLQDGTEEVHGFSCRYVTIEVTAADLASILPDSVSETGDGTFADPDLPLLRMMIWIDLDTLLPTREKAELLYGFSYGGSTLTDFRLQRDYRAFGTVPQLSIPEKAAGALPLTNVLELLRGGER